MSAPHFTPFTWLNAAQHASPHARYLEQLADARDVAAGAAAIGAILESEEISADYEDAAGNVLPALFDSCTLGNLQRLAVVSLNLLAARLEETLSKPVPACPQPSADLVSLVPAAPCAGMMLTTAEAASLLRLRELLSGKGVQP